MSFDCFVMMTFTFLFRFRLPPLPGASLLVTEMGKSSLVGLYSVFEVYSRLGGGLYSLPSLFCYLRIILSWKILVFFTSRVLPLQFIVFLSLMEITGLF